MERVNYLEEAEKELETQLDDYIEDTDDYLEICDNLDKIRDELISLGVFE
jgi:hypothetical protein